ncbi:MULTISPECIES: ComEA family DNA-binding protein [Actinoplanes]|uniref:ComEA family DNA-binding protein n=1 Tax=Actinoplanes TaxID=1865 RepID=UPI0009FA264A|nr:MULTISPECIES: ComEA family DNA-binding protein [Actinoplanes]GLY01485.1 competence protein ComEA [Actinoplanes sp. NBRC 101535]
MREAKDNGEAAAARLRAVLAGPPARPESVPEPVAGDGPLEWSDIVPSWSAAETPPAPGPVGGWVRAFDPGRPGVRALAAVAVLVVAVAGFLAWRSRPRVEPVPDVSVTTTTAPASAVSAEAVVVAVSGRVRRPGLVRLAVGARVADALEAAGGAEPGVDVGPLNLARKVVDGELIAVGIVVSVAPPVAGPGGAVTGGLVNLNTATAADLDGLPGVGPVLAQRILDARDAQGGFRAVADLRKVDGIGDARFEQLKDLVTV